MWIDLVKAFDTLQREIMWRVLEIFGVPNHFMKVLKKLYKDVEAEMKVDGIQIKFPNNAGVKQGGKASPVIFAYVMQAAMMIAQTRMKPGLRFRAQMRAGGISGKAAGTNWENKGTGFELQAMLFADDAGIFNETKADMKENADILDEVFTSLGMEMHRGMLDPITKKEIPSKTVFTGHAPKGCEANIDKERVMLKRGGWIDYTESFKYLGSYITGDTTDEKDITERIKQASKAYGALSTHVYGSKNFSYRVKAQLYTTFVLSILLYGAEAWAVTEKDLDRLRTWHMARARHMARIKWWMVRKKHITNTKVLKITGLKSMDTYLAARTLAWAGHVTRMKLSRLPRKMLTAWVQTPRPRGAPRMTWGRTLKKYLTRAGLPAEEKEWMKIAADRERWKVSIQNITIVSPRERKKTSSAETQKSQTQERNSVATLQAMAPPANTGGDGGVGEGEERKMEEAQAQQPRRSARLALNRSKTRESMVQA